jgi:type IV pilus assembly protein PilX
MKSQHTQQGAALILSLVLLLVLTLLGLSSVRTTTMEEKMASNTRDLKVAFEATESGLREGETWLDSREVIPQAKGNNFVYEKNQLPDLTQQEHTWWTNDDNTGKYSEEDTGSTPLSEVNEQPRFLVEHRAFIADSLVRGYEPPKGRDVYRITARGTGTTNTAERIVQNTFAKRFN